jgi:hypothetical protein
LQGSAFYLSGAGLVIIGWTIIGLCLEAYGFWLLFCEFIPVVLQYSRRIPFMSKVLDVPGLKAVSVTHAPAATAAAEAAGAMTACITSCRQASRLWLLCSGVSAMSSEWRAAEGAGSRAAASSWQRGNLPMGSASVGQLFMTHQPKALHCLTVSLKLSAFRFASSDRASLVVRLLLPVVPQVFNKIAPMGGLPQTMSDADARSR